MFTRSLADHLMFLYNIFSRSFDVVDWASARASGL